MGIPPAYFLDEMENYELMSIIQESENQYIENWNRTRVLVHSIYQSQNSKSLDYEDIFKFPWDEEEEVIETIPKKTKEELKQYALELQDKLNGINVENIIE
jgi:hypothetical protein